MSIETEEKKLKKVIAELNGMDVEELITAGCEKVSSKPAGGAAPAAAEEKKEEKEAKTEETESEDDDMGFDC